jgi:hypothetical protein
MGEQVYLGFDDGGAWPYPAGWHPDEHPEPAATAVRKEPALAQIAACITVHRLHGQGRPIVTRGRQAGLAYLEQRAMAMAMAKIARTRLQPAQEPAI